MRFSRKTARCKPRRERIAPECYKDDRQYQIHLLVCACRAVWLLNLGAQAGERGHGAGDRPCPRQRRVRGSSTIMQLMRVNVRVPHGWRASAGCGVDRTRAQSAAAPRSRAAKWRRSENAAERHAACPCLTLRVGQSHCARRAALRSREGEHGCQRVTAAWPEVSLARGVLLHRRKSGATTLQRAS